MPEVSIILPCYNAGLVIERAIASIRKQTFKDCAIIVVDDGSTDKETLDVLSSFSSEVHVYHQENKGLAAARNTGFRLTDSRFVLPLDCDDYLHETFLEKSLQRLVGGDERTFVFSHIQLIGDKTGILKRQYNFFEQLFMNKLPYCLLQSRVMWEAVGGYDESMREGYEDWEYNIRLGKEGFNALVVPEPLFCYQVSNHGMLKSNSLKKHAQLWQFIQQKHEELYSLRSLRRIRNQWRTYRLSYPAFVYWILLFSHRTLPHSLFNQAFHRLMIFANSARMKAQS